MKPAAFDYVRADTRRQVVELLAEYGQEARIIAGGQSLMAVLNMRLAQPKLLIDINHVAELAYIELRKDCLAVGAGVRQAQLLARSTLMDEVPLLALAMPWIGHFQTRNRGTVCGSVAHADPSAELPLCLVTLGGEIVLESKKASASSRLPTSSRAFSPPTSARMNWSSRCVFRSSAKASPIAFAKSPCAMATLQLFPWPRPSAWTRSNSASAGSPTVRNVAAFHVVRRCQMRSIKPPGRSMHKTTCRPALPIAAN
nr:FAD binding domain-containing protein [Pseudomonas sp. TH39(2020)]